MIRKKFKLSTLLTFLSDDIFHMKHSMNIYYYIPIVRENEVTESIVPEKTV